MEENLEKSTSIWKLNTFLNNNGSKKNTRVISKDLDISKKNTHQVKMYGIQLMQDLRESL